MVPGGSGLELFDLNSLECTLARNPGKSLSSELDTDLPQRYIVCGGRGYSKGLLLGPRNFQE